MLQAIAKATRVGPTRLTVEDFDKRFGYKSGEDALKLLQNVVTSDNDTGIQRVIIIGQILQTFPLGTEINVRYSPADNWRMVREDLRNSNWHKGRSEYRNCTWNR